jgi:transposase InsO family protein
VITQLADEFSIVALCRALQVTRSGYYAWRKAPPTAHQQQDAHLTAVIRPIFEQSRQTYGAARIHAALHQQGQRVGRRRVTRLMRQAGFTVRRPRRYVPRTTQTDPTHAVQPNHLARDFSTTAPNQKWLADITYIPTREGWLYVAGIMDLHGRQIVGLAMAARMPAELVERAWQMAYTERQPPPTLLHHSDRGSQYTSHLYQSALTGKAQVSMSGVGDCWDNAPMESFWATLKAECVTRTFATRAEARAVIFEYVMVFYHRQRLHSSLGYRTPVAFVA